jgi:hypothetical protein
MAREGPPNSGWRSSVIHLGKPYAHWGPQKQFSPWFRKSQTPACHCKGKFSDDFRLQGPLHSIRAGTLSSLPPLLLLLLRRIQFNLDCGNSQGLL